MQCLSTLTLINGYKSTLTALPCGKYNQTYLEKKPVKKVFSGFVFGHDHTSCYMLQGEGQPAFERRIQC